MYDFHFGDKKKIKENPEEFLIFIKRLLPRWINGVPDSECLALFRSLSNINSSSPKLIETGCGSSTIALFLFAALNNGHVYSWDTNGSKGSFLRSVISESICRPLGINLYDYWTFIGFLSTDPYIGIPVLDELGKKADFGYFDSWHTLDNLLNEITLFERIVNKRFIVALDDAYYTKKSHNFSYVNILRAKLGLDKISEPESNKCDPYYIEIGKYLNDKYSKVIAINDSYKKEYKNDIFFKYYSSDRLSMQDYGMEPRDELEHRFDAWIIE